MATPRVKICCIGSVREAELAVAAGAAALGLVSRMPSGPGVISETLIAEIAAWTPPAVSTFLLTALRRADEIAAQHERCRTSTIQLVDRVEPSELKLLRRQLAGIRLVQVLHVRDEKSIDEARELESLVDAFLFDSGNQSLAIKELGGTGRTHDWRLSARIRESIAKPVFLAGGLNAGNLVEAIEMVRPFGLDLCTGVRENGRLSADRLHAFMAAVANGEK